MNTGPRVISLFYNLGMTEHEALCGSRQAGGSKRDIMRIWQPGCCWLLCNA